MVEKIVLHDVMAMLIAEQPAIAVARVDFIPAGVLRFFSLRCEKDVVIGRFWAERTGLGIIVPFLDEQHAGLGAGVRLERVWVQAHNRENPAPFRDEFAHSL